MALRSSTATRRSARIWSFDLRAFLEKKMEEMLRVNESRKDFAQRVQAIIDRYNADGASNESYFDELLKFTKEMRAEDERHVREGLSENEESCLHGFFRWTETGSPGPRASRPLLWIPAFGAGGTPAVRHAL